MNIIDAILALSVIEGPPRNTTDLCNKSVCADYAVKHAACGYSGKFASTCPSDAILFNIDENLKSFILAQINLLRDFIAADQSICGMGTVRWDQELADFAAMNVMRCRLEHDCAESKTYKNWVQHNTLLEANGEINHMEYFGKALLYSATIDLEKADNEHYEHYKEMWLQKNYGVGCAAAMYTDPARGQMYLLTCNYGSNFSGGVDYNFDCHLAGKGCLTGQNRNYSNLCSASEQYQYL